MVKFLDTLKKPSISVVLPVFNDEKYLSDAISSILKQSYANFELIIIDDGSTDNSLKIIKAFHDSRIKVIKHKSNKGLVYSLNEGISVSKGQFIARMDADDISNADRLATQLRVFEDNNVGVVCSNTISIDEAGKTTSSPWWPVSDKVVNDDLLWTNPVVHPSMMIRKSLMEQYHDLAGAEDYELWTRLAQTTKIIRLGQVLLYHRIHRNSIMGQNKGLSDQNAIKINKAFIQKTLELETPAYHQNLTTFVSYGQVKKLYPLNMYIKWIAKLSKNKSGIKIPVSELLWHYFIKLTRSQKIKALWLLK